MLIVDESIHSSGIGTAPTLFPIHPARENEDSVFIHICKQLHILVLSKDFSGIMQVVETFAAVCHNSRIKPWSQSYKLYIDQFL